MRQKSGTEKRPAEAVVKDIRRATRKQYGAEEKIRIVLEGLSAANARDAVDAHNHAFQVLGGNLTAVAVSYMLDLKWPLKQPGSAVSPASSAS